MEVGDEGIERGVHYVALDGLELKKSTSLCITILGKNTFANLFCEIRYFGSKPRQM